MPSLRDSTESLSLLCAHVVLSAAKNLPTTLVGVNRGVAGHRLNHVPGRPDRLAGPSVATAPSG
jgi:hypothetical protein